MRRILVVLLIGGPLAMAQTLLESAVAAAGGSVAGVAGKKVSEGIDAAMSKVANLAKKAATTSDTKQKGRRPAFTPPVPVVPGAGADLTPGAPLAARTAAPPAPRRLTPFEARMVKDPAMPVAPSYAATLSPAKAAPTLDDLRSIEPGGSRDHLLSKMGRPAGRISIPEDGRLVEVYTFRSLTETLGKVRLVNGTVTQVTTATP